MFFFVFDSSAGDTGNLSSWRWRWPANGRNSKQIRSRFEAVVPGFTHGASWNFNGHTLWAKIKFKFTGNDESVQLSTFFLNTTLKHVRKSLLKENWELAVASIWCLVHICSLLACALHKEIVVLSFAPSTPGDKNLCQVLYNRFQGKTFDLHWDCTGKYITMCLFLRLFGALFPCRLLCLFTTVYNHVSDTMDDTERHQNPGGMLQSEIRVVIYVRHTMWQWLVFFNGPVYGPQCSYHEDVLFLFRFGKNTSY